MSDIYETEFRVYDWRISSRYERMKAELRERRARGPSTLARAAAAADRAL